MLLSAVFRMICLLLLYGLCAKLDFFVFLNPPDAALGEVDLDVPGEFLLIHLLNDFHQISHPAHPGTCSLAAVAALDQYRFVRITHHFITRHQQNFTASFLSGTVANVCYKQRSDWKTVC